MSINSKSCRSDAVVRSGIAARLAEIQTRLEGQREQHFPWHYTEYGVLCSCGLGMRDEKCPHMDRDVPALTNAVESVMDYVARCEESGITMQPGDIRRLIAAALGGAS